MIQYLDSMDPRAVPSKGNFRPQRLLSAVGCWQVNLHTYENTYSQQIREIGNDDRWQGK